MLHTTQINRQVNKPACHESPGKVMLSSVTLKVWIGNLSSDNGNTNENVTAENITLFHSCSFVIISTCSTSTEMEIFPGTKMVGVAFKLRKKTKNSLFCAHILYKTLNFIISRCCFVGDSNKMYQNLKHKCRAIGFAH